MHQESAAKHLDEDPREWIRCSVKTSAGLDWAGAVHRVRGDMSIARDTSENEHDDTTAPPNATVSTFTAQSKVQGVESLIMMSIHLTDSDEEAPPWIRSLSTLTRLDVCGATLRRLPHGLDRLARLAELSLRGCAALQRLPASLLALATSLTILNLADCAALGELPADLGRLTALRDLTLRGCRRLRELPPSAGALSRLLRLDASDTDLRALPAAAAAGLAALRKLALRGCRRLRELPPAVAALAALEQLLLAGCTDLRRAPPLAPLTALQARRPPHTPRPAPPPPAAARRPPPPAAARRRRPPGPPAIVPRAVR
jgi:hypothetical protein